MTIALFFFLGAVFGFLCGLGVGIWVGIREKQMERKESKEKTESHPEAVTEVGCEHSDNAYHDNPDGTQTCGYCGNVRKIR